MANRPVNTPKYNSLKRQREQQRDWDEMSTLGKIK